jgi:hypothetical protein
MTMTTPGTPNIQANKYFICSPPSWLLAEQLVNQTLWQLDCTTPGVTFDWLEKLAWT